MDFSKFQSHLSNLDKLEFRTPTRPFVPLLFLTQIAGARLRTGQHDLAITCFYACSYAVSVLVIRVGGSLQTVVKVFTDVLRTSACCVSCWRGDQQSGQYDHAKHKWHLALRYRHYHVAARPHQGTLGGGPSIYVEQGKPELREGIGWVGVAKIM